MPKKLALAPPATPGAPIAPATTIDPSERDYLNTLLQQQAHVNGLINSYGAYLTQRYQLVEGDTLQPDGQITRKAP